MDLNFPDLHFYAKRPSIALAVLLFILAAVIAADLKFWTSEAASQPLPQAAAQRKKQTPNFVPGEILIRFRQSSEISKSTLTAAAPRSLSIVARGKNVNLQIERLDKGREVVSGLRFARVAPEDTLRAIESLNSRSDVLYAEPNYIRVKQVTPNDPRFVDMWNLKNTSGVGFGVAGADIKAEQAWNVTKGSRSIVVAVIDEGIDVNHPDLQPNLWTNPAEIPGNGLDDDSNGFIDDVNGFDFVHNDGSVYDGPGTNPDGSIIDEHGTHVAGTIGATGNNGLGVVGVNWEVSLMSLKFLGPTGGTSANALKAFSYAKMMRELWISSNGTKGANVRVTNNSYGNIGFSQSEADAIDTLNAAGILFVAAAGNESLNNNQIGHYPGSYDVPNIISVASTDRFDRLSTFSNYGSNTVHIGAPGTSILSTVPGGNYAVNEGTSMATPHVAGAAALVLTQHPEFTVSRLRAALIFGGAEITSMIGIVETGNRLDAAAALQNATDIDPTAPAPINDLQVISTIGRSVTIGWTSPGDDGSSGRAVLAEIRFIDQGTGRKYFVGTTKPATAGTQQIATVNIPYQHTNGSLELRVVDNAGNASVANVTVQINPDAANPYELTETAAEPLSTGGTLLNSNFDDFINDFTMPFVFPYFESNIESLFAQGSTSSVFYSTNGTLYFARFAHPGDDAFSTPIFLPGWRMIAGLWDDLDLRTSSRADAGVFVVTPDANRVIFRWQGVPCNTNLSTAQCQGGDPVNFEIELRSDGTIIKRYGSGNTDLAPVVGISAGEFDPYVVNSHTALSSNISLTNAPTITYRLRNPPKKADLKFTASDISPTPVLVGTDANIKLTVANVGPDIGAGARVVGTVPSNLSVTSCTSSLGTCWISPGDSDTKVNVELAAFQPNTQVNLDIGIRLLSATDTNRFFQVGTTWSVSSFYI
jgi:subtilisin family serine protease